MPLHLVSPPVCLSAPLSWPARDCRETPVTRGGRACPETQDQRQQLHSVPHYVLSISTPTNKKETYKLKWSTSYTYIFAVKYESEI